MNNIKSKISPQIKAYLTAILVIFILMLFTYVLTFIIPSGQYQRVVNEEGYTILDFESGYKKVDTDFPFYKFILAPFLVLGADGNVTIIAILAFLIIISGIFLCLDRCQTVKYIIDKIVAKFGHKRYELISIISLFFMLLGSFVGSFEEVVPLVPIIVALTISLGFDKFVGLGISLVSIACGFASGILNPFTIGIAQKIIGLKMFSGISLRILSFVLIYLVLQVFLHSYAKKIRKPFDINKRQEFTRNKTLDKASNSFIIIMLIGIAIIISSTFISFLQDYTLIILTIMFLIAGITSCLSAKMTNKEFTKTFFQGVLTTLPAILMILMACSIKYILVESNILDTILYNITEAAKGMNKIFIILFIYLVALIMNFFIASGSAKAFLLMPILTPIAQIFGINYQLCVLAYAFGDGFSNVIYPTNPVLLISLSLVDIPYSKYFKWALPFQLTNLVLTSGILILGLLINYA